MCVMHFSVYNYKHSQRFIQYTSLESIEVNFHVHWKLSKPDPLEWIYVLVGISI